MISRRSRNTVVYVPNVGRQRHAEFVAGLPCARSRALYFVGEALFEFEEHQKQSSERRLILTLDRWTLKHLDLVALRLCLERLIRFVLLVEVSVSFQASPTPLGPSDDMFPPRDLDAAALFSGGVDSLSGVLRLSKQVDRLAAVFCAHARQVHVVSLVRALARGPLKRAGVKYVETPAPVMQTTGYSQLRGFFYVLCGAAVAMAGGTKRLVISECGPTMYQPRFGVFDRVTMTTHPFVMARAREAAELVSAATFQLEFPNENATKAEVAALCPERRLLRQAHSCISQRFGDHDGTCYGCIVRRLATYAANLPDAKYARNPLMDNNANATNLLPLLDFSLAFLSAPAELPSYQSELIHAFKKKGLFRRFALDNLAALRQLVRKGKTLSSPVDAIYQRALSVVTREKLDERIDVLAKLGRG